MIDPGRCASTQLVAAALRSGNWYNIRLWSAALVIRLFGGQTFTSDSTTIPMSNPSANDSVLLGLSRRIIWTNLTAP